MANANSTGAQAPELPTNPFIVAEQSEDTAIQIDAVLAFLEEYAQGQTHTHGHSTPANNTYLFRLIHVLDGVRDAVKYLSGLEAA